MVKIIVGRNLGLAAPVALFAIVIIIIESVRMDLEFFAAAVVIVIIGKSS